MPRSKYHAQPTVVDGVRFASKREAHRWGELRLLEAGGVIRNLRRQVPYRLVFDGEYGSYSEKYVADFVYVDTANGREVVEDCKGHRTRDYIRKRKWMKAVHGIDILET